MPSSNTSVPAPTGRKRRIFIDFSLVDFRTRVTGIPRVAYAYLEEGHALARELGVSEIVPVHIKDGELHDARPLLVASNWRLFKKHPGPGTFWQLTRAGLWFGLHGLRILLSTLITPLFAIASFLFTFSFFDLWKHKLAAVYKAGYFAAKKVINDALLKRMRFDRGDVLFMPAYWHDTPPGFYTRLRSRGLLVCPMVHDILPITHSAYYEAPWKHQFKSYVYEILNNSDHVYYVSDYSKRAVEQVNAIEFGFQLPEGTVVHHGHDFAGGPVPKRAQSESVRNVLSDGVPYFLMVGSIEPKKNHLRVVAEFEKLWAQGVHANLVIVGRAGWKDAPIRTALTRNPHLYASLNWLSDVNDGDLLLLYKHAAATIQASETEGFGLPVIEAAALGSRVLANDIPVFREIASTFATFFDIHKAGDLGEKIKTLLADPVRAVPRFEWPSWNARARFLFMDLLQRQSRTQEPSVRETNEDNKEPRTAISA